MMAPQYYDLRTFPDGLAKRKLQAIQNEMLKAKNRRVI